VTQSLYHLKQDVAEHSHKLPHFELTATILKCCFIVIDELGCGFLESVYKNALAVTLQQERLNVSKEKSFQVFFREHKIGHYIADLIVENTVIIELKCCKSLLPEHQAQTINYLKVSNIPIGLLVNFGQKKLEYKRLHHPANPADPVFN
jgi:GxxExxY protein